MKIIVSTSFFSLEIRNAIKNKTSEFEINGNEIIFRGERKIGISVVASGSGKLPFNKFKWGILYQFLEELEEQPIVIEFKENKIELSQFVKTF